MSSSMDQVARLLAEIPYIQARPGISVKDVAGVFGITPAQVRQDLGVAVFCGRPGGYPDDLIDVDLEVMDNEGLVYLTNPTGHDRPLSFTLAQAVSLRTALEAIRSLVGADTRGIIDSLMAKLAVPAELAAAIHVTSGDETVLAVINQAIVDAQRLELTYEGRARGRTTHPTVDPGFIEVRDAVGYLVAYSITDTGWRTYRLDRVAEARPQGEPATSHADPPGEGAWAKSLAESETVTVVIKPEAGWITEYYPTRAVRPREGAIEVELPVVEPSWLVRLLLSLGDQVESVDPAEYGEVARDQAQEALDAYEALRATG